MNGLVNLRKDHEEMIEIKDYISKHSRFSWLSTIFDSSNIRSIANGHLPKPLLFWLETFRNSNYSIVEIYNEIYSLMRLHYRNEYVLRNEVINEIYNACHDVQISNTITEFKVGSSRADLAVFNGTSTCYEIKTDIDNLDRLEGQIADYAALFEIVYIVTTEKKLDEVVSKIPDYIGIKVFDADCNISDFREGKSNIERINREIMFHTLRKEEHYSISSLYESFDTAIDPISAYFRSKNVFCSLEIEQAHAHYMQALASRRTNKSIQVFHSLPSSLADAYFSTKMTPRLWQAFLEQIFLPRELNR